MPISFLFEHFEQKASLSIDRPVDLTLKHQYKNLTKKGYSGLGSERGDVRHKQQTNTPGKAFS
jgi:hypothetical protein